MTRKEEVQIIIKDKAARISDLSERTNNIDWHDDENENTDSISDYKKAMQSLITYIDELEKLSK